MEIVLFKKFEAQIGSHIAIWCSGWSNFLSAPLWSMILVISINQPQHMIPRNDIKTCSHYETYVHWKQINLYCLLQAELII